MTQSRLVRPTRKQEAGKMSLGRNDDDPVAKPTFNIKFTDRAVEDLRVFPVSEQKWIVSALESQLASAAAEESDDRKRLRPDDLAEWPFRSQRSKSRSISIDTLPARAPVFFLKKLVSPLLFPQTICLGLLGIGVLMLWFSAKQRLARIFVTIATAAFLFMSYPLIWDGL